MLVQLIVLLLSSHVLPLVQSLKCDESTEYLENDKCCKKCEPGKVMLERCGLSSPDTTCQACGNGFYMDVYNDNFDCRHCTMCTKEYMKYEKDCTPTRDAVCTCDEGYTCSDSKCKMCVKVPTSTTSTHPTITRPAPHTQNNVWISTCTTMRMDHVSINRFLDLQKERLWIQSVHRGRGGTNASAGGVWKDRETGGCLRKEEEDDR